MDEANRKGDGLENFVREAAEKAHYDFDPKAWSAMEKKLNEADRAPFAWWKILFPIGVLAIVLLLIFWPGSGEVEQPEVQEVTKEVPTEQSSSDPTTTESADSEEQQDEPKVDSKTLVAEEGKQEPTSGQEQKTDLSSETTEESATTISQSSLQNTTTQTEEISRQAIVPPAIKGEGDNPQEMVVTGNDKFLIKMAEDPLWIQGPIEFTGEPPGLPVIEYSSDSLAEEQSTSEIENKRTGGAWVFLLSGDLSGTSPSRLDRAGTMFGVLRETYLGKNWSISLGAAYSLKNYSAIGEDYETPQWALNDPEALERVLANCIVIDLPLNVRRYFDTKKGNSFFVSGGLSSYLMLREDYEYIYNEPKPAWADTWEVRNRNRHFFGILNFSIGFERPLTDKLGLNIEPFIKMPISKIGFGQVDLMSFGINLSLKINK